MSKNSHSRIAPFTLPRTFADFFAGIGLMRLGLELQGWSIRLANDIDYQKYEMYRGNFPDAEGHYIVRDIHQLSAAEVPDVCLATASFPCNDLSLAGARNGLNGRQSGAFWGFMKLLKDMGKRRPPLVLLENVTGFLTSHSGKDFTDALVALNRLRYSVDTFIIDASSFVPQSRARLFVIGILEDGEFAATSLPRTLITRFRPRALAEFIHGHPEIRWKFRDLSSPPRSRGNLPDILENLPENSPEWWSKERVAYLLNQMSQKHRQVAEDMIAGRRWSFGTVFRRVRTTQKEGSQPIRKSMAELRTDGMAGCLRTPRGGSGRQILFKAGYGKRFARLLTPSECARLMGADEYRIAVRSNQALFGFGDAVCVPVIEWIAEQYLNPIVDELARSFDTLQIV